MEPSRSVLLGPSLGLALLLALAGPAAAATVVLNNGDQLTGEIREFADGKLALRTAYAGRVNIDWDKIDQVTSDRNVSVELRSGRRYTGKMRRSGEELTVTREDTEVPLGARNVVKIIPMKNEEPPGFWELTNGTTDFGYNLTRGNSHQTQLTLGAAGRYRTDKYRINASLSSIFSRQDDSESNSRHALDGRADRYWTPKTFTFLLLGLERNLRQDLNLRTKVGGGLGRTVLKTKNSELSLLGGGVFTNEQFRPEPETGENPGGSSAEALAGVEWETLRFDRVRFTAKTTFFPNLSRTGRYRIEFDGTMRIPVFWRVSYSLTFFDRFDSDPPSAVKRNDWGLVSALGYTF